MAVYTEVSAAQASSLFQDLGLGQVSELRACSDGIENTNYFVSTTTHAGHARHYVLTLFERLTREQLPFYLQLMAHLAARGIPVPAPHANAHGALVLQVNGKPAAVVDRLPGHSELQPTATHCTQVGAMLARMHQAGRDFPLQQAHLRGLDWCLATAPVVLPYLSVDQQALLQRELADVQAAASSAAWAALPRGPIHADLFRDNVMFDTAGGQPVLSGFFDFYFAGVDSWLFDLAVCLNDWCVDPHSGAHRADLASPMLRAYHAERGLNDDERRLLPLLLRAAALRFWISRLWDFYLPRPASVLQPRDPSHFERIVRQRSAAQRRFDELLEAA